MKSDDIKKLEAIEKQLSFTKQGSAAYGVLLQRYAKLQRKITQSNDDALK